MATAHRALHFVAKIRPGTISKLMEPSAGVVEGGPQGSEVRSARRRRTFAWRASRGLLRIAAAGALNGPRGQISGLHPSSKLRPFFIYIFYSISTDTRRPRRDRYGRVQLALLPSLTNLPPRGRVAETTRIFSRPAKVRRRPAWRMLT